MTDVQKTEELRRVLFLIWKEYKQALKKNLSTPQFIEERRQMVEKVLRG